MTRRASLVVFGLLCPTMLVCSLRAQQPTGLITGVVTDPTGAVVPRAAVTVTNKATGVKIELKTSEGGVYTVSALLPASYAVEVKAAGFRTTVIELKVEVGRATPADVRLEVGSVTETVSVQAEAVNRAASQRKGVR